MWPSSLGNFLMGSFLYIKMIILFFSRRTPHSLLGEAQRYHYGTQIALVLPADTRWGTTHALINNVVRSRTAILQVLDDERIQGIRCLATEAEKFRPILQDDGKMHVFWEVEQVLRPLATAIKVAEGDLVDLAQSYTEVEGAFERALEAAEIMHHVAPAVREEARTVCSNRD